MSGVTGPTGAIGKFDRGDEVSFGYNKETVVRDLKNGIDSIYSLEGDEKNLSKFEAVALGDYIDNLEIWLKDKKESISEEQQVEIEKMIQEQRQKLEEMRKTEVPSPSQQWYDTEEEAIAALHGREFQKEVWSPMKDLANKALDYMLSNGGSMEGFGFEGFPLGVSDVKTEIVEDYSDSSNDRYDFFNGQGHITREVDSRRVRLTFTYQEGDITKSLELYSEPSDLSMQELPHETKS